MRLMLYLFHEITEVNHANTYRSEPTYHGTVLMYCGMWGLISLWKEKRSQFINTYGILVVFPSFDTAHKDFLKPRSW